MPIISFKKGVKRTQRHNQKVYDELANLQQLCDETHNAEQLLEALAQTRNAPLKFNNQWIYTLGYVAIVCVLLMFIIPQLKWLWILAIFTLAFIAYLYYENNEPIEQCIANLEQKIIKCRYDLKYSEFSISVAHHYRGGSEAIRFLKQRFYPLFEQGEISNTITNYASTTWVDSQGKSYPVLVFQYEYIFDTFVFKDYVPSDIKLLASIWNMLTAKHKSQEQGQKVEHLWGVFVFNADVHGFAVSTENSYFPESYISEWKTADIQINKRLYIRGESDLHLAQMMTAQRVLLLNQLFTHRQGYLHCHDDMSIMCFLGKRPLLQLPMADYTKIDDIARVRGHLRKLRLMEYERLQQDLLALLQNNSPEH